MSRLKEISPYLAAFGLVLLLAGLTVAFGVIPGASIQVGYGLIVAGLVLILAYPFLRPDDVMLMAKARQTRYGGNALVLVLAVIGILVALNFFGTRFYYVADLTANKQFSISRQTVQILEQLKQPVDLTAMLVASEDQTARDLEKLVDKYKLRKPGMINYTRLDPNRDRMPAMGITERLKLGPVPPGRALVAESGGKHAIVSSFDEQAVTEAIVKVTRAKDKTVWFTNGHGEMGLDSSQTGGLSSMKTALEQSGYKVSSINVAISPTLSITEMDAIIIAGPQRPFSPGETKKLAGYVAGGGKVMLLADVAVETGLADVLAPWAIKLDNDLALDEVNMLQSPSIIAVQGAGYQSHTITKDMAQLVTIWPSARSLTVGTPASTTFQTTALAKTGEQRSWGETNLEGLKKKERPAFDAQDVPPPLTLATASEAGTGYGRLVVFGTSSLVSDSLLQQLGGVGNLDLVLNAVSWLTQDEDLISIRPKDPNEHPLTPPTNPLSLLITTVFLLPLAVLGLGTWIWWQRR